MVLWKPSCFGTRLSNSRSLSLAVLGNFVMLLSPVTREELSDFLKDTVEDFVLELSFVPIFEPTFSRKKYMIGPATVGIQAQITPMSPSSPLHSAMSL